MYVCMCVYVCVCVCLSVDYQEAWAEGVRTSVGFLGALFLGVSRFRRTFALWCELAVLMCASWSYPCNACVQPPNGLGDPCRAYPPWAVGRGMAQVKGQGEHDARVQQFLSVMDQRGVMGGM